MYRAVGSTALSLFLGLVSVLSPVLMDQNQALAADKVVLQLPWTHQFEFAGFYAAKEKGFYAHEGLEVEIRPGGPSQTAIAEVLNGNADFGVT
ncbi:ABC transporter substrate-binding protein, partial [Oceanospirillum sp. HFRX-1_2]